MADEKTDSLSVFSQRKDKLGKHEFMMGSERGRLGVTLGLLTEALVLVGQHQVYCRSGRNPTQSAMDIRLISQSLGQAKQLIQSVMEEMRAAREQRQA